MYSLILEVSKKTCIACGRIYTKEDLQDIWIKQGYNPQSTNRVFLRRKYCGGWCAYFKDPSKNRLILGHGSNTIIITRKHYNNYVKEYGNPMIKLSDITYL